MTSLGSWMRRLLAWWHSSIKLVPNVRMSTYKNILIETLGFKKQIKLTLPHDIGGFSGVAVLAALSKYLRPLSISLASEDTLKALMDCMRPKSCRWVAENVEDWETESPEN